MKFYCKIAGCGKEATHFAPARCDEHAPDAFDAQQTQVAHDQNIAHAHENQSQFWDIRGAFTQGPWKK